MVLDLVGFGTLINDGYYQCAVVSVIKLSVLRK